MSEIEEFDLDRAAARAWDEFEGRLALEVLLLDNDGALVIEIDAMNDGCARYVQLVRDGARLHLEVSSNAYLADRYRLTPQEERALAALGLAVPAAVDATGDVDADGVTLNWTRDALIDEDGHLMLAALAVAALRDVFGVVHPAFVHSDQLDDDEDEADAVRRATIPTGWGHLRELVAEALESVIGHPPLHDEDDDIPVVADGGVTFVRVQRRFPIVELFTTVIEEITNLDAAQFEVGVLNRDATFVRYVLTDGDVTAHLCLPARPFVPQHLQDMLEYFTTEMEDVAGDLAHRVGGTRP